MRLKEEDEEGISKELTIHKGWKGWKRSGGAGGVATWRSSRSAGAASMASLRYPFTANLCPVSACSACPHHTGDTPIE